MAEARPPSVAAPAETPPPPSAAEADQADPLAAEVARAVRELRLAQGLSERAAARLLGTSQTQLRRMEDQRYMPSLRSLSRLATAYGQQLKIDFEPKDKAAARPKREERPEAQPEPAVRRKPPGPGRRKAGRPARGAKRTRSSAPRTGARRGR